MVWEEGTQGRHASSGELVSRVEDLILVCRNFDVGRLILKSFLLNTLFLGADNLGFLGATLREYTADDCNFIDLLLVLKGMKLVFNFLRLSLILELGLVSIITLSLNIRTNKYF